MQANENPNERSPDPSIRKLLCVISSAAESLYFREDYIYMCAWLVRDYQAGSSINLLSEERKEGRKFHSLRRCKFIIRGEELLRGI